MHQPIRLGWVDLNIQAKAMWLSHGKLQLAAAIDRDIDGAIERVGDRLRSEFQSATTKFDAARLMRRPNSSFTRGKIVRRAS